MVMCFSNEYFMMNYSPNDKKNCTKHNERFRKLHKKLIILQTKQFHHIYKKQFHPHYWTCSNGQSKHNWGIDERTEHAT